MITRELTCKICKGKCFTLTMKYKKENELNLLLCHDGMGFQFQDAVWQCVKCKHKNLDELEWIRK